MVDSPPLADANLASTTRRLVAFDQAGQALPPRPRVPTRLWRNPSILVGTAIVTFIIFIALAAPWLAPRDPDEIFVGKKFAKPSAQFPLGGDALGRDLLSRLMYGARPTIGSAALATALIAAIGVTLGIVAGYSGGLVDDALMRVVDILLAVPSLLLAIAVVGILGPGLLNIILGAALIWWAGYARLVRGLALQVRERPFVEAAFAIGVPTTRILQRHILPNIIAPVVVLASLEMGTLILIIAGLNFLGLGVQPPTAEWGAMLNQGRAYFQLAPEQMLLPGLMITITVLGFNLLGDGLRDVLDPRHA